MSYANEFRRCLEELDIAGIRKLWRDISPHLPQPGSDAEALATLHHARTEAGSIAIRLRAYSHHWLLDHGLPSGLPDALKPEAERLYPRSSEAVGIAVRASSPIMREIVPEIRGAMEAAVLEAYADRKTDPVHVKARMFDARERTIRQLIGRRPNAGVA